MKRSVIFCTAVLFSISLLVAGNVLAQCVPPPTGMVGWWPLDETAGSTATDIVGGYNGIAQPGPIGAFTGTGPVSSFFWPPPTFPPGKVGTSLFFYGNRRVEVPHNTALDPGTGDFTIDAWVIYAAAGNGQYLTIVKKANPPTPAWWQLVIRDVTAGSGKLRFDIWAAPFGVGPEVNITPNTWHHVAATLKRSPDVVTLYVDGVDQSFPVTLGSNVSSGANLLIGGDGVSAGEIAIDELEIFNRVLDSTEIKAIWNADSLGKCKCTSPPDSMVGWWPGDNTPNDIVLNNNGTLQGGATYTTPALGKVGPAFSFTAAADFVDGSLVPLTRPLDFGTGPFSI